MKDRELIVDYINQILREEFFKLSDEEKSKKYKKKEKSIFQRFLDIFRHRSKKDLQVQEHIFDNIAIEDEDEMSELSASLQEDIVQYSKRYAVIYNKMYERFLKRFKGDEDRARDLAFRQTDLNMRDITRVLQKKIAKELYAF